MAAKNKRIKRLARRIQERTGAQADEALDMARRQRADVSPANVPRDERKLGILPRGS